MLLNNIIYNRVLFRHTKKKRTIKEPATTNVAITNKANEMEGIDIHTIARTLGLLQPDQLASSLCHLSAWLDRFPRLIEFTAFALVAFRNLSHKTTPKGKLLCALVFSLIFSQFYTDQLVQSSSIAQSISDPIALKGVENCRANKGKCRER